MTDMTTAAPARPQRARRMRAVAEPASPAPAAAGPAAPAQTDAPTSAEDHGFGPRPATRKPFGVRRQKLFYPVDPRYHRHWFHDEPGRIKDALDAGWRPVKGDDGRAVQRAVDRRENGSGVVAHLMEIPIEWYKEDQVAKFAPRDAIDAEIRRGVGPSRDEGAGQRYGSYGNNSAPGFTDSKVTAQSEPSGRQFIGKQTTAVPTTE